MTPYVQSYTPAATSATGYKDDATGASTTLTVTTAGDGLAHKTIFASGDNLSGITLTLTGTDADGKAQTGTIAGPNNNTVTDSKYYKTLTSVTFSGTLGASVMDIGWSAVAVSPTLPLNHHANPFAVGLNLWIVGTINVTVQHTFDNIYAAAPSTLNWMPHATLAAATASADSNYAFPIRATRLLVNSVTASATVKYTAIQNW